MPKIKIFNPNNVQQYGFTGEEIEALNAEWEQKASELGLEEHLPEYWQEAKRHMSEKLDGLVAESPEKMEIAQPDGEAMELPSLDVDLDDLDSAGEEAFEELPELESISVDDLELEVSPEEPDIAAEQGVGEKTAKEETAAPDDVTDLQLEDMAQESEAAVEESVEEEIPEQDVVPVEEPEIAAEEEPEETAAPDDVTDLQLEDMAQESEAAAEESVEEEIPEQDVVPVEEPEIAAEEEPEETAAPDDVTDLQLEDMAQESEAAAEESVEEEIPEQEAVPVEEQKTESFFGRIIGRLKRMF